MDRRIWTFSSRAEFAVDSIVERKWFFMQDPSEPIKEKWYWPTIVDIPSAVTASNKGVWAAGFVAATSFVISTAASMLSREIGGFDGWTYIDAAIFALIRGEFIAVIG